MELVSSLLSHWCFYAPSEQERKPCSERQCVQSCKCVGMFGLVVSITEILVPIASFALRNSAMRFAYVILAQALSFSHLSLIISDLSFLQTTSCLMLLHGVPPAVTNTTHPIGACSGVCAADAPSRPLSAVRQQRHALIRYDCASDAVHAKHAIDDNAAPQGALPAYGIAVLRGTLAIFAKKHGAVAHAILQAPQRAAHEPTSSTHGSSDAEQVAAAPARWRPRVPLGMWPSKPPKLS